MTCDAFSRYLSRVVRADGVTSQREVRSAHFPPLFRNRIVVNRSGKQTSIRPNLTTGGISEWRQPKRIAPKSIGCIRLI